MYFAYVSSTCKVLATIYQRHCHRQITVTDFLHLISAEFFDRILKIYGASLRKF